MNLTAKEASARDAYVALVQAHEALGGQFGELFRARGLTHPQYNVLRILRGAGADGVSCQYIGERLLHRLPDVTRLLDRMEVAGLVVRRRSVEDRRVVLTQLTPSGRELCDALDEPVTALHREQFRGLSRREIEALRATLQRLARS